MITVRKGDQTTRINKRSLSNYQKAGWEVVVKTPPTSKYDSYTKKQLIGIGEARGLNMPITMKKDEMIEQLIITEGVVEQKPKANNKGFTDGLIIEE